MSCSVGNIRTQRIVFAGLGLFIVGGCSDLGAGSGSGTGSPADRNPDGSCPAGRIPAINDPTVCCPPSAPLHQGFGFCSFTDLNPDNCPPNSTSDGFGTCFCNSGFVVSGSQCVRDGGSSNCGDGVCDGSSGELTNCPQDCPANCGDGVCNVSAGEQRSCPQDCPEEQCCVETNGCPSEELFTCPGDCCCCDNGARCVRPQGIWVCGI